MKNADVFVVRILPFVLYLILGINIILGFCGVAVREWSLLYSYSAIYASSLLIVSLSNKKYHCLYNRLMYAVLIIAPVLDLLDFEYEIIEPTHKQYNLLLFVYLAVLIATALLAVNHFIKRKTKK